MSYICQFPFAENLTFPDDISPSRNFFEENSVHECFGLEIFTKSHATFEVYKKYLIYVGKIKLLWNFVVQKPTYLRKYCHVSIQKDKKVCCSLYHLSWNFNSIKKRLRHASYQRSVPSPEAFLTWDKTLWLSV